MSRKPEIYFHVGLGKIASTYLQKKVFPKLRGIQYIPTGKYKKRSKGIIAKGGYPKFLVSREFDRQFEREVRWFTSTYPEARIIILFRRHDSWIASQYRRYVKNGWYHDFNHFLDLENDSGMWKQKDLMFYPKLQIIEECCLHKPLVLFHDELIQDNWSFLNKISEYTATEYDQESIYTNKVHTSFSEDQLRFLKSFCRKYIKITPKGRKNKIANWLLFRPWWAFFHLVLYLVPVMPKKWIPNQPLISEKDLSAIKDFYKEDWEKVKDYAAANNELS